MLSPFFFVNVASKGLRLCDDDLESAATGTLWTLVLRELGELCLTSKYQTLSSDKDQTLVTSGCSLELDRETRKASPHATVSYADA